ncbi:MAG: TolC family protein [Deltaproteobacteria bacterium]|nr:TolC family protein [Deltaproteobacteria bacterium]
MGAALGVAARTQAQRARLREPSLAEVLRMAERWSVARVAGPGSARARARWAKLVPRVAVSVRRGLGSDRSLSQALSGSDRTVIALDDSLSVEVTATLPLDDVVFTRDEVALSREESRRYARRADVALAVARAWARWRAARRAFARTAEEAERDAMELAQAELDAWTGGGFTRALVRLRR